MAGGELPQVRQRELRDRQGLRLHRRHRDEHQDHGQPRPQAGNAGLRDAEKTLAAAERDLAGLRADSAIPPAVKNTKLIPAAQRKITSARKKLDAAAAARDTIPAKLPANVIDLGTKTAVPPAKRRGLQMVLRLLAHNAEHWLSGHLDA